MTIKVYVSKFDVLNKTNGHSELDDSSDSRELELEWEAILERQLEQEVADWGVEKPNASTGNSNALTLPTVSAASAAPVDKNVGSDSDNDAVDDRKLFEEDYQMNADSEDEDGNTMSEKYEQYTSVCRQAGEKHSGEEVKAALNVLDTVFDALGDLVRDGVYPRSKELFYNSPEDLWQLMHQMFPAEVSSDCKW